MSSIKTWFNILKNNEVHANNKVSSRDLALCFNFLQIPDTKTIVVTLAVMKNKIKKVALPSDKFAGIMSCIEEGFTNSESELEYCYGSQELDGDDDLYFCNTRGRLSDQWYMQLCCHRVFFIPVEGLWDTIKNLFKQENIQELKSNDVSEVSVYINTEDYDCNAKFY